MSLREDKSLSSEQRRHVQGISISASHQLNIVNNVIDMTKIETGSVDHNEISTFIYDELINLERLFFVQASEKGINLSLEVNTNVPYCLIIDKQKLIQILTNLIGNAIKFTSSGKIVISVQYSEQQKLLIDVRDTGPGIAPEDLGKIFDRFHQADNASTRQHGGSGLGLAISLELAKVMGGTLSATSQDGDGASFVLSVPVSSVHTDETPVPLLLDTPIDLYIVTDNPYIPLEIDQALQCQVLSSLKPTELSVTQYNDHATNIRKQSRPHIQIIMPDVEVQNSKPGGKLNTLVPGIGTILYQPELLPKPFTGHYSSINKLSNLRNAIMWSICQWRSKSTDIVKTQDDGKLSGIHILVAEDNEININVILEILRSAGAEVDIARNGKEALECVGKAHYDILLIDVQMPVMSGLEFVQRYNLDTPEQERVPVFILTADAMDEIAERSRKLGVMRFILKPFDPKMLIDNIYTVIKSFELGNSGSVQLSSDNGSRSLLDTEHLQSMCESFKDSDYSNRLITIFQTSVRNLLDDLKAAVDSDDHASGRATVHTLISSTGSMGAKYMSSPVRELYEHPAEGWSECANKYHQRLCELLPETVQALNAYIGTDS